MEKLFIIGFGPGGESMLTDGAKDAMNAAKRILSTGRFSSNSDTNGQIRGFSLSELMNELTKNEPGATAVLVSGDCGFFSAAKTIINKFSGIYDIELTPGISSIQYFSAKIKIPYDGAALISLHGRDVKIVPKVAYNSKIFALTGGENDVARICRELCSHGLGDVSVSAGERLSYPDERITLGRAREFQDMNFDALSVIYIENPSAVNPHRALSDGDFIRGDAVPMTKEEARWLSIRKLNIEPDDIVFDIGAGTGSVSVEMARKAFDGFVYSVEAKEEACALVRENAARHGAFNIEIVHGEAPGALDGLPAPDKAFIGGSSGNMDAILEKLLSLNPKIKITANAVTLQTLSKLTEGFTKYGIAVTDIICVNIAKSKKVGGYDMMTAQNPVYIVTGGGYER